MSILVTGAGGIVGRPLVRRLVSRGHRVIGLCRRPPENACSGIDWLTADVSLPHFGLDNARWTWLCRRVTSIVHLAARTDFNGSALEDYVPANVDGVAHVKKLALLSGAWLHHVSTAFVCGDRQGLFSENQLDTGQGFHNPYEQSKFYGERLLHGDPFPRFAVYRPAVILERHPQSSGFSVFGPLVFLDAVFRLCLQAAYGTEPQSVLRVQGNADAWLPFVFDDDLAVVLADLFGVVEEQLLVGRTFHLVPPRPLTNHCMEKVFNRAFGRRVVRWVNEAEFSHKPPTVAEKILIRKTRMYRPYLDFRVHFDRRNLDVVLGRDVPAAVSEQELLASFAEFLAGKKELVRVRDRQQQIHLENYFGPFLHGHTGRSLIPNLTGLSACLQIEIKEYATWTIDIKQGILTRIVRGGTGDFGYITDADTFLAVASGKLSPQEGFFRGGIQLVNNHGEALRTATALEEFFQRYPYKG